MKARAAVRPEPPSTGTVLLYEFIEDSPTILIVNGSGVTLWRGRRVRCASPGGEN